MKKLIVLIAISVLISTANADMPLSIAVSDDLDPQDGAITLEPSDILQLGIHTTTGYSGTENTYWFMTTADTLLQLPEEQLPQSLL